ncbi:hypothetical protein VPH35_108690 [Triticum aestivum]|uniref:Uncharacterized protein n=1 Tax=Triticum turgidum subsp. durum TaxID=4567 RepID=A0A9R1B6Z4_TRITD|nr:unnamed protein product [Triticum turgidum subsp. durum]
MLTCLEYLTVSGRSRIVLSPIGGEIHVVQVPVEELSIYESGASGKELTQLLSHFPKLTSLNIERCENITELGVWEQQSGGQQQETKEEHKSRVAITSCEKIAVIGVSEQQSGSQQQQTIEEEEIVVTAAGSLLLLPTQLQKLRLQHCRQLRIVPSSGSGGDNNEAAGGLQRLSSLRQLRVENCPNLLSSYSGSSSCFPFPTPLEKLELSNLEEVNLDLTNLSNLEELNLSHMEALTNLSVSRSSKLHTLYIEHSPVVLSVSTCSLLSTYLTRLIFKGTKDVEPIAEEALLFLTSLQELQFGSCHKLQFLPAGLHTLANIYYLRIDECPSPQLLPKDGLPTSLQKLLIEDCPAIKSLAKYALPSSLQELVIRKCPEIKSLPKDGLPKSLRLLDVRDDNSEKLKRQCRRLIGTIPIIMA